MCFEFLKSNNYILETGNYTMYQKLKDDIFILKQDLEKLKSNNPKQ